MKSDLSILHQDEHFVVVAKPARLLSVRAPGSDEPCVADVLAERGIDARPVHRLDRDVSGAMILALDDATKSKLEDAFRERAVRKTYWALAQGHVRPAQATLRQPILEEASFARVSARGKEAITRYRTLESLPTSTVVEVEIATGRYNQIRVHFAHAGFPLVGERKYARGKDSPVRAPSRRVALHAWKLAFPHPVTGALLEIEAPLTPDLVELRAQAARPIRRR